MANLVSSEGIICRSIKYGETSLILDIYSPQLGLQSYIINGIRSSKAKTKASVLQVLNIVQFVAYDQGHNKLSRLKEIHFGYIYRQLPFDVVRSSVAMLLIEICRYALRVSDENEEIYTFIKERLIKLDEIAEGIGHFHIRFLIDLAPLLGFGIMNNYSANQGYFDLREGGFTDLPEDRQYVMTKEASELLAGYLNNQVIPSNKHLRLNVLLRMIDFYRYHLSDFGELKSLAVINSLYN